jgi:hypothetical protein
VRKDGYGGFIFVPVYFKETEIQMAWTKWRNNWYQRSVILPVPNSKEFLEHNVIEIKVIRIRFPILPILRDIQLCECAKMTR